VRRFLLAALFVADFAAAAVSVVPRSAGSAALSPGDLREAKVVNRGEQSVALEDVLGSVPEDQAVFLFEATTLAPGEEATLRFVAGAKFAELLERADLRFTDWQWNAGAPAQQPEFLYEEIQLLAWRWWKKHLLLLGALTAGVALLVFFPARRAYQRHEQRQRLRAEAQALKSKVCAAGTLESFVEIWVLRDRLKVLFPEHAESLQRFYTVLNKYQFKVSVSSEELREIQQEQTRLAAALEGASRGV